MRFVDVDPADFIRKSSTKRRHKNLGDYYSSGRKRKSTPPPPGSSTPPDPTPPPPPAATPASVPPTTTQATIPMQRISAPRVRNNTKDQYYTANYKNQVFIAIVSALLVTLLAGYYSRKTGTGQQQSNLLAYKGDPGRFLASWLFLGVTLVGLASFRGTDKLAAAFAWLIFVAVLLVNGEMVFTNLSANPASATPPVKSPPTNTP